MSSAPWLAHYDAGVPPTLAPYPDRTLLDYVAEAARDRPGQAALLFKGGTVTNAALERLSDAFASALVSLGVARGDRVALLLANCPQFFIAELAAWKIGAIVAPLNPIYAEPELERPLRDHDIETVVTLSRFYERVKRVQPRTPVRRVIATNIKAFFPPLLRLLFTLVRETRDGDRIRLAPEDHDFSRLLQAHATRAVTRAPISRRSRGAPDERRHDRDAKGCDRDPRRVSRRGVAAARVARTRARPERRDPAAAADVPRLCQRRGTVARARRRLPARTGAESARPRRSPRHHPPGQAGVLQRRPDTLCGAARTSRRQSGKADFRSICSRAPHPDG